MSKNRIFLSLLISFIVGVCLASFIAVPVLVLGGIAISGIFLIAVFWRDKKSVLAGFLALIFVLGVWRCQSFLAGRGEAPVRQYNGQGKITVKGQVSDEPANLADNQKFVFSAEAVEAGGVWKKTEGKILVSARRFPEYQYGDKLEIAGSLKAPENFSDFDYASYLAKDDIYSTLSYAQINKTGQGGSPVYRWLFGVKNSFEKTLGMILPEPHASFLSALLLGARKSLPAALVENFSITGTTHIIALSGFNITIISSFVIGLLTVFWVRRNAAFWLAIAGIAAFTLMTGASASVVRAAVMGILVLWAQRESRLYSITNAVVFAGALMLFVNPRILRFDVGFQLSFMATLGLIYLSPVFQKWLARLPGPAGLKEMSGLTLAAQVFTLPLIVYHFGRLSLVALPANLAVLTFVPLTMFFGFLAGGVGLVSVLAGKIAASAAFILLSYEMAAINFLAKIPFAAVSVYRFSFAWAALAYLGLAVGIIIYKAKCPAKN